MRRLRVSRPCVGKYFSEGARLLWLEMRKRELDQASLADLLGTSSGQVNQWLYGGRGMSLRWALAIRQKVGIAESAWLASPQKPFTPPAKAAA